MAVTVGFFTVRLFFFSQMLRLLALTIMLHSTVPCRSFGLNTPKHLGTYGGIDKTEPQISMQIFHKKGIYQ